VVKKTTKTAPWVKTETPAGIARRLGFDDRVNARDAMARVLAAGEALREAASAYDAALSAMPQGVVGYALGVEVDEITEDDVSDLVSAVTNALGVDVEDLDGSEALVDRARERAREHLKRLNNVAARQVDEVLERLTGVVSMKVTPQLHALERAIYDARQAENAKGTRP
jgi:hypothetical protein